MDFILTSEEKTLLLSTAREVIASSLEGRSPRLAKPEGTLRRNCGAFVTLHSRNPDSGVRSLRGCIGHIVARHPLFETVAQMAYAAAFEDPRFPPMTREDWALTDIEISALSPLWEVQDVSEIELGVHGIYISRGFSSGLLLPQVATEQGWDRETFLTHGCYKAGLPGSLWKDKDTRIEIFSAIVFGELND